MSDLQHWGIVAATSGGVVNAVGYTVQRRVLLRAPREYLCNPWWWFGFALLLAAETLGGVALALVPASIVVALGSVSVVASATLAALTERLTRRTLAGTLCIVVGSVLGGLVTPTVETLSTSAELAARLESTASVVYHALAVGAVVLLHIRTYRRPSLAPIVIVALYAGIVSSVTALWFRPVVTVVMNREWSSFGTSYVPYVSIALVAVTGTWAAAFLEPKGLGTFLQSQWIPVHFVSCLVFFGVAGEVVYRDFAHVDAPTMVTLLAALVNIVWGILLVQGHDQAQTSLDERRVVVA